MLIIAGAVSVLLIAFASGYGYHRDELYFIAAGQHLDWAYADQGPVTPLIARAMTELSAESLTVLRLPSALAAGLTVLLTGLLARELGGSRRAQTIAAACAGVGVIVLFTGHMLIRRLSTCLRGPRSRGSSCVRCGPATIGCGSSPVWCSASG